jgi:hypothetical protein
MQFSPPFRHSTPVQSKYFPQHPVLKHPQFMFLSYCQRPCFGVLIIMLQKVLNVNMMLQQLQTLLAVVFSVQCVLKPRKERRDRELVAVGNRRGCS